MDDTKLYKCPMCDTENCFRISELRATEGYCIVENETWIVSQQQRANWIKAGRPKYWCQDWYQWFAGESHG